MITFDFETKSWADLPKVGAWVYSEHPTTEVICAAYGVDDEPIQTWWPGKKLRGVQAYESRQDNANIIPRDLYIALMTGHPIEAHNVSFERSIWANICIPEYGWVEVLGHQWRDTMAVAAYYAMPQALDKLANALGFEGKNPDGKRLISKYSKLGLKTAKQDIPPEDFEKFVQYCVDDVILEQAVSDELGDLPKAELEVFHMDQEINLRGIHLDEKSIRDASAIVEKRGGELAAEFREGTGFNPTQTEKVKGWFGANGLELDNLQADYLEGILDDLNEQNLHNQPDLAVARRMLQLRLRHSKASTKKLTAMLNQLSSDGRAKFQCKYHGAATGRPTGTGFQPLNLSKGFEDVPPEQLIADISHRDPEWLDIMYGDAMDAVGKASRHHIKAQDGYRIIAGDYVSIEAVLLACTAREDWKIEAFRNKDPIYELMGCKIHNLGQDAIDLAKRDKKEFKEVYPSERFDGKTGELAFGYQGGLGAWLKFDSSERHSEEAINQFKDGWREEHPAIKQHWYDMEEAAIEAVMHPGRETAAGPFCFEVIDEWLAMRLPNGKRIWYRDPQLRRAWPPWHKPTEWEDCSLGECDCKKRPQLTYMSQKTGRWMRVSTYGGKLTENGTQATSREVLVPAMKGLRAAGYPIILTVYDEIITEVPEDFGSVKELIEIMAESPGDWARDWPISVDAWEGDRYRK